MLRFLVLLVIAACFEHRTAGYTLPDPNLEVFTARGFTVSIIDDGFSWVGFYGKLNEKISLYDEEDADWLKNITTITDGKWVFRERNLKLAIGDKVFYWVYVAKDDLVYRDFGLLVVTDFIDSDPLQSSPKPNLNTSPVNETSSLQETETTVDDATTSTQQSSVDINTSTTITNNLNSSVADTVIDKPSSLNDAPAPSNDTITTSQLPSLKTNVYEAKPNPLDNTDSAYSTLKAPSFYETQPFTQRTTTTPKCEDSLTEVHGQKPVCGGSLIFSDEFVMTTNVNDLTNWDVESKFPEEPDYPFNVYMPEHTLNIISGSLVITPVLTEKVYGEGYVMDGNLDLSNSCSGKVNTWECTRKADGARILPPVMTGKVNTKNKFAFKYGKVEIRAKLPTGAWLMPEINLEPLENVYGNLRYESGIIRIAFTRGNDIFAKKLYGGPVLSDEEPYRSFHLKEKIGTDSWNKEYHNYSMVWKPDSLDLFVDGEQYGSVLPGKGFHASAREHVVPHASSWLKGSIMAPLDQMFYISLGLRVGGVNDFADGTDVPKPWENHERKAMLNFWTAKNSWLPTWHDANLKVDYIKVYAL